MSDRDYLYGHVCVHGSLARSCEICDLEDLLDEVQEALTWAEAPVRHDGGYLTFAERVRDLHRERDEARAGVRRLREERRGMVAEASWDQLADEMTEVEADNARLRAALTEQRDAALSETVDCYNCCDGCPMDAEDYPGWLTAPWALIGDNRE